MREILPGIIHWTTFHKGICQDVHSYYASAVTPACLIDPRVPDDGIEWFDEREKSENIYLTNRHH